MDVRKSTILSAVAILIFATSSDAFSLEDSLSNPTSQFYYLEKDAVDKNPSQFSLQGSSRSSLFLANRKDLSFDKKLWTFIIESHDHLSWHAEKISLKLKNRKVKKGLQHYYYDVLYAGVKIDRATVTAHLRDDKVINLTTSIPSFTAIDAIQHNVVDLTQAEEADGKIVVYAVSEHHLKPFLRYHSFDPQDGWRIIYEDFYSGSIIQSIPAQFDIVKGRTQVRNERDAETELRPLPYLTNERMLKTQQLAVATEHEIGDVESENESFDFQPYDRPRFDQVAVFANVADGMYWFEKNFNHNFGGKTVEVTIHTTVHGSASNAAYLPTIDTGGNPQLLFGKGESGGLENLARDKDVAMHELSHHVIFSFINDKRGTSASLHEGFADYFTYAFSGDPYLAEQIQENSPYLRTGNLSPEKTYDSPRITRESHSLGQVWAAYLWDIRKQVGESFDQTVYQSLYYLNASSNFGNAIEALILADRDQAISANLQEDAEETPKHHGPEKCRILDSAVKRGYSGFLGHIDGEKCGLDMEALVPKAKKTEDNTPLLFKACAQISNAQSHHTRGLLGLLMFLPILLVVLTKTISRRRHWN